MSKFSDTCKKCDNNQHDGTWCKYLGVYTSTVNIVYRKGCPFYTEGKTEQETLE